MIGLRRLGRYLRRAFGDATTCTDQLKDPRVPRGDAPHPATAAAAAREEMVSSAEHLKFVSRELTRNALPKRPDSFEQSMRQLLGRLN